MTEELELSLREYGKAHKGCGCCGPSDKELDKAWERVRTVVEAEIAAAERRGARCLP